MVGGVDIRGSATGSTQLDVLAPRIQTSESTDLPSPVAVLWIRKASGVMRFLESKGIASRRRAGFVPLVPSAIIFDLGIGKKMVRPGREMGEQAAAAASGALWTKAQWAPGPVPPWVNSMASPGQ
jgi:L-aminopeptidase/D-esterase-like protein